MEGDITTRVVGGESPDRADDVDPSDDAAGDPEAWADPRLVDVGDAGTAGVFGGRYRVRGLLGRGGVADVYRATDDLLGRDVAVKVVRSDAPDPEALRRFALEMRTHAGLSHPHLVTVLDAGTSGARPFLVMELVEGGTLADKVTSPSSAGAVAGIGADIASGLAHVHARGIVHRDLKPANVLLGSDGRVVLSDFGIARLLDADHGHTATGFTIGTAAYFAPEQVTGGVTTTAVDVYALALVLLEALTGQRVYPGPASQAALTRLHTDPVMPAGISDGLRGLLGRMTQRDPAARPSASEVEVQLRALAVADDDALPRTTLDPLPVAPPRAAPPRAAPPRAAPPLAVPARGAQPRAVSPRATPPRGRPTPDDLPTTGTRRGPGAVMVAVLVVLCVIGFVLGAAVVDATRGPTAPPGLPVVDGEVGDRLDDLDRAVNGG